MGNKIERYMALYSGGCSYTHEISSINVHSETKLLKSGRNYGFDCLTSDSLLNASLLLYGYLSFLFTCMLPHSFSPFVFHNDSYPERF